ncbi:uncharacterized protein LOC124932912 [Impatiens glandulifera]|uniref:uncharacterized protein LOC124932912 n=1 Tax=Impatiens glandulifera TaxID=253017 RepID=UPI001FB1572A|nr:uncharacterized protein LOC124932912 [Impatiens glandulifera]
MERGVVNLHQSEVEEDKLRYQRLLEDYLRLQKGLVSKKRKMQNLKQKRFVLQAEVRFLRKRYQDILKTRSSMPKKRKRNQTNTNSALDDKNPYETALASFPMMENKIDETLKVEMEPGNRIRLESVSGKRKPKEKTIKKTVEKKRNRSQSNAAPVSHPIMEGMIVEDDRVEKLSKNSLVVDNTGKMGKKKRVTWQDQVVPKV